MFAAPLYLSTHLFFMFFILRPLPSTLIENQIFHEPEGKEEGEDNVGDAVRCHESHGKAIAALSIVKLDIYFAN